MNVSSYARMFCVHHPLVLELWDIIITLLITSNFLTYQFHLLFPCWTIVCLWRRRRQLLHNHAPMHGMILLLYTKLIFVWATLYLWSPLHTPNLSSSDKGFFKALLGTKQGTFTCFGASQKMIRKNYLRMWFINFFNWPKYLAASCTDRHHTKFQFAQPEQILSIVIPLQKKVSFTHAWYTALYLLLYVVKTILLSRSHVIVMWWSCHCESTLIVVNTCTISDNFLLAIRENWLYLFDILSTHASLILDFSVHEIKWCFWHGHVLILGSLVSER